MRLFIWISVLILGVNTLLYGDMAINSLDTAKIKYKRALDSATYAAAKYRAYASEEYMENIADGFNENILVNKEEALEWFYRVFFRNINMEDDKYMMAEMKKYIILKSVIGYDKMYIAGKDDKWIEMNYEIEYNGKKYRFTLSDKLYDIQLGIWKNAQDIGLDDETRTELVTKRIKDNINNILNLREYEKNKGYYYVDFGIVDKDINSQIKGINFVAFVEGMPIPAFNMDGRSKLYAVSFAGAEISRK
ncbi:MAG TPA: hypothetical protein DEP72_04590 [Clostridiales bacterium]|nr:MAG: hypothetical protein A2Y18_05385 [Clostridiales bacterium GWD2_32_19]HCC07420.1 hypothetical protein [Clostridiales bacterium]